MELIEKLILPPSVNKMAIEIIKIIEMSHRMQLSVLKKDRFTTKKSKDKNPSIAQIKNN